MALYDRDPGRDSYAVIRFGHGWPARGAPVTADAMLARLAGPDRARARFAKLPFAEAAELGAAFLRLRKEVREEVAGATGQLKKVRNRIRDALWGGLVADLSRIVETDDPFRERLSAFWANHFATRAMGQPHLAAGPAYVDEALRPHLAGRFGDLLKAAVTHPVMLYYLDQNGSVGPNSTVGLRSGRGLNENLAREVLELHTLGVGAGYGQADVTQFAELLTGLTFSIRNGTGSEFRPGLAEPGAEVVLGRSYGGGIPQLADIHAALEDLAVHPATAAHLSRKLAAHFVADAPDPGLVAAMTDTWRFSGGDLAAVYRAMLDHPAAWSGFGAKVKPPRDFVASALRALGVSAGELAALGPGQLRKDLIRPLGAMAQGIEGPPGPDGFPDEASAWVQPFGLAQRISWAMAVAARVPERAPADFARAALGDAASARLLMAAGAAETRAEGVGLVLASAEFNRR